MFPSKLMRKEGRRRGQEQCNVLSESLCLGLPDSARLTAQGAASDPSELGAVSPAPTPAVPQVALLSRHCAREGRTQKERRRQWEEDRPAAPPAPSRSPRPERVKAATSRRTSGQHTGG